jgi:beta-N-acetylhexosaminidase
MTAHVLLPAIDDTQPATLSPAVVGRLLRDEIGFDGLVVSDDFDMQAIAGRCTAEQAAVAAVGAGCDCLLLCSANHERHAAVLEELIHAVEQERLPLRRVENALAHQRHAKEQFLEEGDTGRGPRPAPLSRIVGCAAHQAIAAEMARFA